MGVKGRCALRLRDALSRIATGAAGGAPWAIFAATFSHVPGPWFVPIEMKIAGKESEVTVEGRLRTKAEVSPKVVLPQGWVNVSPELTFAHPGRCAETAKVRWQGP